MLGKLSNYNLRFVVGKLHDLNLNVLHSVVAPGGGGGGKGGQLPPYVFLLCCCCLSSQWVMAMIVPVNF